MRENKISMVIPTLNEKRNIQELLAHLEKNKFDGEIIIADGGSSDETTDRLPEKIKIVYSETGRGTQMNAGAQIASGDILWFVHADCRPHLRAETAILEIMQNSNYAGGAFEYVLDQPGFMFRISEYFSNKKNKLFKLIYGDMGIFVRKEIFNKMGGYAEIPIMEDLDLCLRLKKEGRLIILPHKISTSARRWDSDGIFINILRNWLLQISWLMGISPDKLIRWYSYNS